MKNDRVGGPRRQHYLPATFLANFSDHPRKSRRKSTVVSGDKICRRCFTTATANVATEKDIYTVEGDAPYFIEEMWTGYEARLAPAIEGLTSKTIDAFTWVGVLVPFVASLFVRTRDFDDRFAELIKPILAEVGTVSADNTTTARILELQRLLAPVLAATWIVSELQDAGSLVTTDLGWAGFRAPQAGLTGLAIPLTRRHVLHLVPCRRRTVAVARGSTWYPVIHYRRLRKGNHLDHNAAMAEYAMRFIFGPDEATVSPLLVEGAKKRRLPKFYELLPSGGYMARVHEFTWHRLVEAVAKPPDQTPTWNLLMDWEAIARVSKMSPVLPVNPIQRDFPAGLVRDGDMIRVDLYDVDSDAQLLNRPSIAGFDVPSGSK